MWQLLLWSAFHVSLDIHNEKVVPHHAVLAHQVNTQHSAAALNVNSVQLIQFRTPLQRQHVTSVLQAHILMVVQGKARVQHVVLVHIVLVNVERQKDHRVFLVSGVNFERKKCLSHVVKNVQRIRVQTQLVQLCVHHAPKEHFI